MANPVSDRKRILKDSARYLTSTFLGQGFVLVRGMLMPVLFGPAQLGVWNLMNVIIGYGANAHLGILHGFNKKVPALRALGRTSEFNDLKDSVFWINLLLGLIVGAVLILASFLVKPIYASALRIIALVVVLQIIYVFYFSLLRADNRFDLVSKGIAGLSFCSSILILLLAYYSTNRLLGALYGLMAAYPFVLIYWYYKGGYRFTSCLKWTQIKDAFRMGLPLIILGLIDMVLLSLDRWIIAWQLPDTALGFYAVGIMASSLLGMVPAAAANILYPRMLERFALTVDYRAVGRLMLNPMRAMAVTMIFLISVSAIFLPLIVRFLLPKYIPAIELIEILVPGAYFLAITAIAGTYVIAINRQSVLVKVQFISISCCLVLYGILLYAGYGVQGIAYATVCGYASYGFGYLAIAVYLSKGKWRETLWFMVHLFTMFGVMVITLKITNLSWPDASPWADQVFSSVKRLLIVSGVLLPFVWLVNRKSGMLSELWSEFTSWRAARSKLL